MIESWIKALPNPENDEALNHFHHVLVNHYHMTMEDYLNMYETSDNRKMILSRTADEIIKIQSDWIPHLREKMRKFFKKSQSTGEYNTLV